MFEPVEWMQMLAKIDVCVNETTPTKFVDEEGHDNAPLFMVKTIGEDTSSIHEMETIEVKALCMRDEVSIWDLSIPFEDLAAFYDVELEVETEFSSQEESPDDKKEAKPIREELFFDFHNQKPSRQRRYTQKRTDNKLKRNKTMPRINRKKYYLELVRADDVVKDKVTGCYLTHVRGVRASTKRSRSEKSKTVKKDTCKPQKV